MSNKAHVESIAQRLTDIYNGLIWYCPDCGKEVKMSTPEYDAMAIKNEYDMVTCPDCDADLEQFTFYNQFEDVYDIEYRVESKHADTIKSVSLMVAFGGPNIYVDTADCKVKLYWWRDYAECEFSRAVGDEITDMFNELWNC